MVKWQFPYEKNYWNIRGGWSKMYWFFLLKSKEIGWLRMQKAFAEFSAYVPQHISWLPWRLGNLRAYTLVVNQLVATKSHEAVSIFVTLWKCQFLMTSTENKMAFLGSSQYLWEYGTGKWAVAVGEIYRGPVDFTVQNSVWPRIGLLKNSTWPRRNFHPK